MKIIICSKWLIIDGLHDSYRPAEQEFRVGTSCDGARHLAKSIHQSLIQRLNFKSVLENELQEVLVRDMILDDYDCKNDEIVLKRIYDEIVEAESKKKAQRSPCKG